MSETILLGRDRHISLMPRVKWEQELAQAPEHIQTRLGFMSKEHHQVRYFVVREFPNRGAPIAPAFISESLQLPLVRVNAILDELEQNLFFLVQNEQGAVAWAFPVTTEPTPHRLTFSTGEQLYGA